MTQIKTERSVPSLLIYTSPAPAPTPGPRPSQPLHHRTVSHRALAQGNHCSEMQTTQLKMTQALKTLSHLSSHIPPTPQSLPTGVSEWKSQIRRVSQAPKLRSRAPRGIGGARPSSAAFAWAGRGWGSQEGGVYCNPKWLESRSSCLPGRSGPEAPGLPRPRRTQPGPRALGQVALGRLASPAPRRSGRPHPPRRAPSRLQALPSTALPPGAHTDTHPRMVRRVSADTPTALPRSFSCSRVATGAARTPREQRHAPPAGRPSRERGGGGG